MIFKIESRNSLSIKDLVERMGVSPDVISRQINGNPTLKTITDIAEALDVEVKEIFSDGFKNEPSNKEDIFIVRDEKNISIGSIDLTKFQNLQN